MTSFFKSLFSNGSSPARDLYRTVVEQSRHPAFFLECGVPDTPNGRFEVLVLHLFLLMRRMQSEEGLAELARALSEEAVQDIDRNLREMGVGDLSVGRKVKSLAEGMYGRFGAYTDGLSSDSATLSEALERNLYSETDADDQAVAAIVVYLQREISRLEKTAVADLQSGKVVFGPPPGSQGE